MVCVCSGLPVPRRANEVRGDGEDGEGRRGGGARRSPLHCQSRDFSCGGRQSRTINAQLIGISPGRKNIPRGAGEECVVGGRGWVREGAGGGTTRSGDGGGRGRGSR
jgi:hypothetical protein